MRQDGFYKSTEFTKKQISVIYGKAKSGALKVEKWFIAHIYDLADYSGYDDNGNVAQSEREVKTILNAVFENDLEKAQELINKTADDWYERAGKKTNAKRDRNAFVG